jgi:hypothetical protein
LPLYRLALVAHCFDKTIETWDDLDSLIRFPHSKMMQIDVGARSRSCESTFLIEPSSLNYLHNSACAASDFGNSSGMMVMGVYQA